MLFFWHMERNLTVGVDFGTSSVRAVILDGRSGEEIATAACGFPSWDRGDFCDPPTSVFRQHPAELIESFVTAVSRAVAHLSPALGASIRALTVDTTGSSPTAVDHTGRPLALQSEFAEDPDAMVILWKDRSAVRESGEITSAAENYQEADLLAYCGRQYSPEWFWAKILHTIRTNQRVAESATSWLEHSDWFPALLCGITSMSEIKRNRCAAAHKALWHRSWGGFPAKEFFHTIDPALRAVRETLPDYTAPSNSVAGYLTAEWAERTGLPVGIPVGVSLFDAHSAAIGAGVRPGTVSKVIGTSSAEMIVADPATVADAALSGIESQAQGSIIPELIGIEAGQPAYGDLFEWFSGMIATEIQAYTGVRSVDPHDITAALSKRAASRRPKPTDPVTTDWINGRRAPFSNGSAKTAIEGIMLASDATALFASLVQGVAFGTRAIHDYLESQGITIQETRAVGGIPQKAPYVVQTLADVLNTPVGVSSTPHASARGAAIMAAVVAGMYKTTTDAIDALSAPVQQTYTPISSNAQVLDRLYRRYLALAAGVDPTFRTK